jgi:predicted GTPase
LIGRTREQARLDAALRTAADGSPVTVLITGEAGIGKTRLVAELLRCAPDDFIMRKLGVNRRADAARLAKQVLVEDPPPNS